MKLHAIKEYVTYRYKAQKLHGVHSPFAYDFAEKVLYAKPPKTIADSLKPYQWLPTHYRVLLGKLSAYYNYNSLLCLSHDHHDAEVEQATYDLLVLKDIKPGDWVRLFNKYLPYLNNNSSLLVAGIHKTKRHTAKWERLCKHPKVLMSIDLYGIGLLFFRKEFKEKQHFVLKY